MMAAQLTYLLVFSLHIDGTLISQSFTGWQLRSLDQIGNSLAGRVNSTKEGGKFL